MDGRIKLYFKGQDFFCPDVWKRHGERAWAFFAPRLVDNIVYIRTGIDKPVIANTWSAGGLYSQRGFRRNLSSQPSILPLQMHPYIGAENEAAALRDDFVSLVSRRTDERRVVE